MDKIFEGLSSLEKYCVHRHNYYAAQENKAGQRKAQMYDYFLKIIQGAFADRLLLQEEIEKLKKQIAES